MLKITTERLKSFRSELTRITQQLWDDQESSRRRIKTANTAEMPFEPFYLEWIELRDIMSRLHQHELSYEDNNELVTMILETIHFEMMHELLHHIPEEHHETVVSSVHNSEPLEMVLNTIDVADGLIETRLRAKAKEVKEMIVVRLED